MPRSLSSARGPAALAVALAAVLLGWALTAGPARGADEQTLRERIASGKQREQALASAAQRLARLERRVARELGILESRLADVESQLAAARRRLTDTRVRLDAERRRLRRLRSRLAEARAQLAEVLRHRYMTDPPDLVSVVLDADGFGDLLSRLERLQRIEEADAEIVEVVRRARSDAAAETRRLAKLERQREEAAQAVERQHRAISAMRAAAAARRATLARARAARAAALRATRADRRRAQRELDKLLAERRRAASTTRGPGGPWAIPWAIVQCESGGQNLPPNSAGASGYYQFMPETWRRLGGSTPHAYQAPKAEQDRLAAKLWDGGRGAHNWVCAALVGID
jgi:peptidoglycan hydrolase CwlO-like protein